MYQLYARPLPICALARADEVMSKFCYTLECKTHLILDISRWEWELISIVCGQSYWLQIQRSRVRSPALPDFLSSSGSGTGSTQPREPREVN